MLKWQKLREQQPDNPDETEADDRPWAAEVPGGVLVMCRNEDYVLLSPVFVPKCVIRDRALVRIAPIRAAGVRVLPGDDASSVVEVEP